MPSKYTGYVLIKAPLQPTELQKRLLAIVNNEKAMREAHRILGEMCQPYVPEGDTGGLRRSMKVYPASVKWEAPYAHYQYTGIVYGPNIPIVRQGIVTRWRSIPNKRKKKTNRELGVPGEWKGWKFGYTTPGTTHHWYDKAMEGRGKNNYSVAVTNMLKKMAEKKK